MTVEQIKQRQNSILNSIKENIAQKNRALMVNHSRYVWFYPQKAHFLYDDLFVPNEIILPLIDNKILVYTGVRKHQGELMPRYSLK